MTRRPRGDNRGAMPSMTCSLAVAERHHAGTATRKSQRHSRSPGLPRVDLGNSSPPRYRAGDVSGMLRRDAAIGDYFANATLTVHADLAISSDYCRWRGQGSSQRAYATAAPRGADRRLAAMSLFTPINARHHRRRCRCVSWQASYAQ